jgi:hypothetical protein
MASATATPPSVAATSPAPEVARPQPDPASAPPQQGATGELIALTCLLLCFGIMALMVLLDPLLNLWR